MSAKPSPKSWRDLLPVHHAADLFPLMSPDELKALGEDIKKNGLQASIVLDYPRNGFLIDGRNRLDAMEAVGLPVVRDGKLNRELVKITSRPISIDVYEFVVSANIHRRHLTAEQKRDLIAKLLKATPEKSDRQIAETVKASPTTVGTVRTKLEATGDVSKLDTRQDTKGRKQPAKKKRPTEDDFRRQLQAKKAATIVTDAPADSAAANPITTAWDNASDEQRQEFLQARHLHRKRGRPPTGSKTPPQPKRKGGWPKGKPRKSRREAA
jgi:hypothetical protein